MLVAVVGKGRNCPAAVAGLAEEVGAWVGQGGHDLLSGGLGGVMAASVVGASSWPVQRIGLLPIGRADDACARLTLALRTGLPERWRNVLLGEMAEAMIALRGSDGTYEELAVARDRGIPVCAVGWEGLPGTPIVLVRELQGWLAGLSGPAGRPGGPDTGPDGQRQPQAGLRPTSGG